MRKQVLLMAFVLSGTLICSRRSVADGDVLSNRLAQLERYSSNSEAAVNIGQVEDQYLRLLDIARSDSETGQVYTALATVFHSKAPDSSAKITEYCGKAVSFPIPPTEKCRMYDYWAESLLGKLREAKQEECATLRPRIAELYLRGLSTILAITTEDKFQDPPAVGMYHYDGSQAAEEEAARKHAEEEKNRERVVKINKLVKYRHEFIDSCVALYRKLPEDSQGLRQLLEKHLADHKDVADHIWERAARSENRRG
jgi:hypothetical protein